MIESNWDELNQLIVGCQKCERLLTHCQKIAEEKRKSYQDWEYWGKPVSNFGDPQAELLIVGLAPAAHGANRTGRMFTGDRSGDWLYRALHKAGFANQPKAENRSDGLLLRNCAITAACHCAPPANKPSREEIENCHTWLEQTVKLLPVKVFLALGQIGWKSVIDFKKLQGELVGKRPPFAHGATFQFPNGHWLVGSYHPSQQNTFTGRLTEPMFDSVFELVKSKLITKK
ncbi:MAG: uracil-DNA glycosylase [Planctomycetes bacterium]|nr:uracil-DNA glycosylase [Planctomycetota bacterium]MCH9726638.1 uracil-DNA glycosylase [Planctomycetota bacterium]MCH9779546.1 uracil-DNA glycosylase [Planctomycetota bacterium]MCH9793165.1 uracil-DNA glycosylase [Planctomycetota bacterium]MDF1743372.1 uracil-DNA glycosylase [Gimesia sp.]